MQWYSFPRPAGRQSQVHVAHKHTDINEADYDEPCDGCVPYAVPIASEEVVHKKQLRED